MTEQRIIRPYTFSLPRGEWLPIDVHGASFAHPINDPPVALQPNGQLYSFYGPSAPPETPGVSDFPGIVSSGYGVVNLTETGRWWLFYDGSAGNAIQLVIEPLNGREAPGAAENYRGSFFRQTAINGGAGFNLAFGVAQNVFAINPRRKELNLNIADAALAGAVVVAFRFDGSVASAANHDIVQDFSIQRSLRLIGEQCPKGGVSAILLTAGPNLLTGSQWG